MNPHDVFLPALAAMWYMPSPQTIPTNQLLQIAQKGNYNKFDTRLQSEGLLPREMVGWFIGFYGISTFVGYLMLNPFLCK